MLYFVTNNLPLPSQIPTNLSPKHHFTNNISSKKQSSSNLSHKHQFSTNTSPPKHQSPPRHASLPHNPPSKASGNLVRMQLEVDDSFVLDILNHIKATSIAIVYDNDRG